MQKSKNLVILFLKSYYFKTFSNLKSVVDLENIQGNSFLRNESVILADGDSTTL